MAPRTGRFQKAWGEALKGRKEDPGQKGVGEEGVGGEEKEEGAPKPGVGQEVAQAHGHRAHHEGKEAQEVPPQAPPGRHPVGHPQGQGQEKGQEGEAEAVDQGLGKGGEVLGAPGPGQGLEADLPQEGEEGGVKEEKKKAPRPKTRVQGRLEGRRPEGPKG